MTEVELLRLAVEGQPLAWRPDGKLYYWDGGKYQRVRGLILTGRARQ